MTQDVSTLYAQILGETAQISWQELEKFFAQGVLFSVDPALDLVAVAESIADDNKKQVSALMQQKKLYRLTDEEALNYQSNNQTLWAIVLSPWILVQNRSATPNKDTRENEI